jgi:hypothetical protein
LGLALAAAGAFGNRCMKYLADLDFALNRQQRARRRKGVIATLALAFGLQFGVAAWRLQVLNDISASLQLSQQQMQDKSVRANPVALTSEQVNLAKSAQAMLDGLAVPWDGMLQAIEAARPPRVIVDTITPQAVDGLVGISVSSPDFDSVAQLISGLRQQESLYDVMLTSEALPDNGGVLRAVVTARWRSTP